MIVLKDNFTLKIDCQTYIALGSFDGIHLGHISLIKKIVELSKKNNVKSMVFTFNNHPLSIINPERAPKLLIRNEEKLELLEKNKVDIVNLANFNTDLMKITPEDFIKRMKECYNVKGFVAGFNYRFGYKNQGDVTLLKDICSKLNVETYIMDSVMHKGEVISSTRIRELLAEGDIITTNEMLTEPFFLCGIIIKGKQLGHKIGFPTVNLEFNKDFAIPKSGVYFTVIEYNKERYKGITNIGNNPTVNGDKLSIETHILDFDKNIYGENIKIYFLKRMRNESTFNSIQELANQLEKDKKFASEQCLPNF